MEALMTTEVFAKDHGKIPLPPIEREGELLPLPPESIDFAVEEGLDQPLDDINEVWVSFHLDPKKGPPTCSLLYQEFVHPDSGHEPIEHTWYFKAVAYEKGVWNTETEDFDIVERRGEANAD